MQHIAINYSIRIDRNYPCMLISIDEAQLLMPRHDGEQTVMGEILTTMRYKGIAVLAAGVSADLMSMTLLDTGIIAQYRSHSQVLAKSLAITDKLIDTIPTLSNYQYIVNMSIRNWSNISKCKSVSIFTAIGI